MGCRRKRKQLGLYQSKAKRRKWMIKQIQINTDYISTQSYGDSV